MNMKRFFGLFLVLSFLVSVPVHRADEGMWTFDNPPLKQWKERYNFEPSKEWLDKVRLARQRSAELRAALFHRTALSQRIITSRRAISDGFRRKSVI
jgi:hypothetical protein